MMDKLGKIQGGVYFPGPPWGFQPVPAPGSRSRDCDPTTLVARGNLQASEISEYGDILDKQLDLSLVYAVEGPLPS